MVKGIVRVAQLKLGEYHYNSGLVHLEENRHFHAHNYIIQAISTPQIPDKINTLSRLGCYQAISALFINDPSQYLAMVQCLTQNMVLESSQVMLQFMEVCV
ncbi:unnamed protein product [Absidia cylindrospora]